MRTHVFLDVGSGQELVLPTYVQTGYAWRHGMGMETVSLTQLGDMAVPTVRTLCAEPLRVLLPAHNYPFCVPGANLNPWTYLEALERRCDARAIQRYIITGTPVNAMVYIKEISYSEEDGTGDLTVTISLQEAKIPLAEPVAGDGVGPSPALASRDNSGSSDLTGGTYIVVQGDTMWAIARRYYGDGSLCWRLATYNQIPNANVIRPGQAVRIPPADQLPTQAAVVKPASVRAVEDVVAQGTPEAVQRLLDI